MKKNKKNKKSKMIIPILAFIAGCAFTIALCFTMLIIDLIKNSQTPKTSQAYAPIETYEVDAPIERTDAEWEEHFRLENLANGIEGGDDD